ncbi:MAG: BrnT family toxin [Chloroflexi bacterium]|nr:BrnT family toxin [Chloroflexota bacterium]
MFEWDALKEQLNITKHKLDFRTAARIFLDPYLIEFEDARDPDESRWNAIGIVDGRVLFVTYTERNERIRIIPARGAEPHERRKYHDSL